MNDDAIYRKTEAGQREIEHRSAALDARHRRLLILLDGRRAVSELQALAGAGAGDALTAMLLRLQVLGLATREAPAAPAVTADAAGWLTQRQRAVRLLNETLGPAGDGLALRLESLRSAEQLPELLHRCRELVADLRGAAEAERFASALATPD